jgi:hypothetical protein
VRRIYLSLLVMMAVTVGGYTLIIQGSAVRPDAAQAHVSCEDYWQHSGHVEGAVWYHCHNWQSWYDGDEVTQARVHICGASGVLHGIDVRHVHRYLAPDRWETEDHAHDGHGEGC